MQTKRFGWFRAPSAWDQAQTWRARRSAAVADFQNSATVAASAFANATSNQILGTGELVVKEAAARMQSTIAARLDRRA